MKGVGESKKNYFEVLSLGILLLFLLISGLLHGENGAAELNRGAADYER